jgi:hypothetical protein
VRETLDDIAEVRIASEFIEVLPPRMMTLVPLEPEFTANASSCATIRAFSQSWIYLWCSLT